MDGRLRRDVDARPTGSPLSAGYNHESIDQKQRSRSRPEASPLDSVDFDWLTSTRDSIDAFYVGLRAALIPGSSICCSAPGSSTP